MSAASDDTSMSIKRDLESALSVAHKCGYVEYEYKLGLALGEVELKSGAEKQGSARLERIIGEANHKGFRLIVRDATELLKTQPAH